MAGEENPVGGWNSPFGRGRRGEFASGKGRHFLVGYGRALQAWSGRFKSGWELSRWAGQGTDWQVRPGKSSPGAARHDTERQGMAGMESIGSLRCGLARLCRHGSEWLIKVSLGPVRIGIISVIGQLMFDHRNKIDLKPLPVIRLRRNGRVQLGVKRAGKEHQRIAHRILVLDFKVVERG